MWACMSHKPGIRNLPVPSKVSAPAGTKVSPLLPRAKIRPSLMTTVWSGWDGAPVASITVTCVIASAGAEESAFAWTQAPSGHRSKTTVARHRLIVVSVVDSTVFRGGKARKDSRVEERMMLEEFGKDYGAYMATSKRLVPGVCGDQ